MELRRYLHLLRQRRLLVALTILAGLAGGYIVTNRTTNFVARASLYVGSRQFPAAGDSASAAVAMDRLTQTFAAMVKSPAVAEGALQTAHVPRSVGEVVGETSASVVPNTNLITVTVVDPDAGVAQSLANGVAQSFVSQVANLEPGTATGSAATPGVSIFQAATVSAAPAGSGLKRNVLLGGLLGLVLSVGAVLSLEYLDITVKSAGEVERVIGLPVLGIIPIQAEPSPGRRPVAVAPVGRKP